MRTPGNMPGNKDEVHITVMPTFPDSVTVAAPLNIPDVIPNTGGGSVMSPNGDYLVAGEQENYYSGGGKADIFPGGGTRIQTAGLGTGLPQISALAAGIILSGLLLISGLIWACWKCKPGKCGSGGGKSSTFLKKAAAALGGTGSERELYTNRGTGLLESAGGYSTGGFAAAGAGMAGAGMAGYGHGKMLDLSPGMDVNSYRMERFEEVAGPNVYNADMKVDCCEISANSKYAVTGSANGPPQVWDMVSGDLFKVMDGSELAARDLHLGCDDQVLVGQVVDDINIDQAMETRRLQLWHFQTGQQMEMQENVMCTATCLTNMDKNDAIVARVQPEGPSILVWDLVGNEAKNRIAYNPISNDPVTYLRTSLNDRLVVAGVGGENGKPAYYMVFDLCANNSRMVDPKVIEFDAEIGATEILSDFEAVTGTRDGNLFVWNMMTCQPIRQIQMSAIIEDKSMVALPPHNGTIHCVTLSKDGQYIVTGSADQTVKVWKRYEEQLLHSLEGHNDDVLSVFISPDSEVIVSGSWDGSIRVWRLRDGNQMCWFTSNIEILQVKLSNDKRAIIGLGERNGNRKLIMLQIIRNRTTVYGPNGSLSPSLGPASP